MSVTRRMRRTVSITMRDLPRGKRVQGQEQMPSARLRTGRQTGIRPDTEPEQYVVSDNAETKRGAARKKSEKEGENEPCAGDFADFVCFVWN